MHIMYGPVSTYTCRSRCIDFWWLGSIILCVVSCYLHLQLQTSLKNSTSGRCSHSQCRSRAQNVSACLTDLDLDRLTFEAGIKSFFVLTVVIYRYQLLYIVIRCYLLLFVVIRCYLLLSVICCYPLLFVVICCYLLLSVVICCYLDNDKYRRELFKENFGSNLNIILVNQPSIVNSRG